MNIVSPTELRKNLKHIMDVSLETHEPVIIKRSRGRDMTLVSFKDYRSLEETAYLLGTKANADRLRESIKDYEEGRVHRKDLKDLIEE